MALRGRICPLRTRFLSSDRGWRGWGLEEDVGAGIAEGELLFHLDAEVVFGVFGFPVGAGQVEGVEQGGVGAEGMFAGAGELVFGDEEPFELAGALFEEVFEGSADVAFVVEFCAAKFFEGFVVGLDGCVGLLEIELSHSQGMSSSLSIAGCG
jgi:hypothetical protein